MIVNEAAILEEIENQGKQKPDAVSEHHVFNINESCWKYWQDIRDKKVRLIPALGLFGEKLPYYMLGKLIIIGGYTSSGKSTLLAQMVADICQRTDAKADIISLEDSRDEKYMALVSVVSDVGKKRLVTGDIYGETDFFLDKVIDATGIISGWPVKIYDDKYSMKSVEKTIDDSDAEIIFLDYVQNLAIDGGGLYERMSNAARELFRVCKKKGREKCLIVLSQVGNEAVKEESDVIGLKGAGELAANADVVIMLKKSRKEETKRSVEINFAKNRLFGVTGRINCEYSDHWTRIEQEGLYPRGAY